jgi:hypothetical protein
MSCHAWQVLQPDDGAALEGQPSLFVQAAAESEAVLRDMTSGQHR